MNITHHAASAAKPSEQLTARPEFSVTDARGRRLTLRKPPLLTQFKLVEILGPTAENSTYLNMVLPIAYVAAIDDEQVRFPSSRLELDALIQKIDEDGLEAVHRGIAEHIGTRVQEDKALEVVGK